MLIGAKRGGSTTLARSLTATPGVASLFPSREALKGTYFFDVNFDRGEAWYRSHFPTETSLGSRLVGDASPYYLSHPHAAERARALVPDARIICVLRDPVDRAFSHYRERVKQGVETLATFEEALAAEPDRLAGELDRMIQDPNYVSWNHLNFGYVAQSMYGESVARWVQHWPSEQLLFVRSEDMYANPDRVLQQALVFLGLQGSNPATQNNSHQNQLPPADVASETRRRLWNQFHSDVERLAALLDEPTWWTANTPPSGVTRKSQS